MNDLSLDLLLLSLVLLVACSAYFSGSATALMSLNHYRLRHFEKQGHKGAKRANRLLERPDQLVGALLAGSRFVNILASVLTTILAIRLWGTAGILIAAVLLTVVILVFAELSPKTIAALHPERIAFPSSLLLRWLLLPLYPVIWLASTLSRLLVRLLRLDTDPIDQHRLTPEELRSVIDASCAGTATPRQRSPLNMLELDKVTVNDVMIPRNDVIGIDLEDSVDDIVQTIINSQHTRLPVFKKDLNNVVGILHMRGTARLLGIDEINKAEFIQLTQEAYFIPENTPLATQLINFQKHKQRYALVVDEYGDVLGIVTLTDILDEIVGNLTTTLAANTADIHPQGDGSYLIDGGANIREINRALDWNLPVDGPKTLNGLLTEMLESIPENHMGIRLPEYCAEIIQVKDNMIKSVRMWAVTLDMDNDPTTIPTNLLD